MAPLGKSGDAVELEILSAVEGALLTEMIVKRGMDGGELPHTSHAAEPQHPLLGSGLPASHERGQLPPSKWLVQILSAIVHPEAGLLAVGNAVVRELRLRSALGRLQAVRLVQVQHVAHFEKELSIAFGPMLASEELSLRSLTM